jgi:hypothetical protein
MTSMSFRSSFGRVMAVQANPVLRRGQGLVIPAGQGGFLVAPAVAGMRQYGLPPLFRPLPGHAFTPYSYTASNTETLSYTQPQNHGYVEPLVSTPVPVLGYRSRLNRCGYHLRSVRSSRRTPAATVDGKLCRWEEGAALRLTTATTPVTSERLAALNRRICTQSAAATRAAVRSAGSSSTETPVRAAGDHTCLRACDHVLQHYLTVRTYRHGCRGVEPPESDVCRRTVRPGGLVRGGVSGGGERQVGRCPVRTR